MNTQIIAIANQKGGVGKTTTCANLGIGLAQAGKKVLLIDGDPQGSLTISLGNPQPDKLPFTLSDAMGRILMDEPLRPGEGILHHPEGVDLMPADIQLSGMEVSLVNAMSRETILRQYLDTLKGQYSHILIDCQPSLGMDLDVEVSRLKLMKADHQSKQYRLEDQLLKYFPEEIEKHKGFIKGFESDLEVLAAHPHPEDGFAGMEIRGDLLTDKENAGAALLDACKEVKTSDPVQIGSYRGYAMSVEFSAWKQEYTLLLKGQMTHRATLGTDPRGNLTRIDNALAQMPQRLEAAKAQLDNLYQQQAAAKEEVGKSFLYEEELRSKNARLVELDTLLNIDGKGHAQPETVVAKSARPSVLDSLKRPATPRSTDKKPKQHEEVR